MKSEVPREIRKWNWSAFLLGPIWAIGNKVLVGLLGCLPSIATFILMFLPFILMPFGRDIAFVPLRILWLFRYTPSYLYVLIYLAGVVTLGFKGNEWAWKSGSWNSVEQFKKEQIAWANVSTPLGVPVLLFNLWMAASVPRDIMAFFGSI